MPGKVARRGGSPDLREQVAEHVVLRKAIGAGDEAVATRLIGEHMADAVRRLLARRATITR